MDKQKTVWKAFMELVNSKEIGVVITRQEIIQYINKKTNAYNSQTNMYPYGCKWVKDKFEAEYYSLNTVDYIRNLSEKVGYLDKTRCAGVYVVSKHFPEGYTVSQLRKDYDSRTW
nr:MAG TPA: hypothetical protein [Caudoviricetes sp.]